MFVLELIPLGGEQNLSHAHKTGSQYLLEIFFKISNKHIEVPPLPLWECIIVHLYKASFKDR